MKRIIFVLSFLSACGPIYSTDYNFSPPRSAEGRACVFQCEIGRQQCNEIEGLKQDRCEHYSDQELYDCERDIRRRKGREPKWYECSSRSCDADSDRCDQSYRYCYQACGGEVNQVTNCVANCDQQQNRY